MEAASGECETSAVYQDHRGGGGRDRGCQKAPHLPAVPSQMLRQIEEEAGTPLFERGAQVFRPTYAGERYLHAAEVILNTNEILENELREIRGEERGRLRLGISVQRSIQLLPKVLPEFTRLYPRWSSASTRRAAPIWTDGPNAARWIWPGLRRAASPRLEYRLLHPGAHRGSSPGRTALWPRDFLPGPRSPCLRPWTPLRDLRSGHSARIIQERLFREQGLRPVVFLETDIMEAAGRLRSGAAIIWCVQTAICGWGVLLSVKGL